MEKIDYDVLYRRALEVLPDAQVDCYKEVVSKINCDGKTYLFQFVLKQFKIYEGKETIGGFYYWQFDGLRIMDKV